MYPYAETSTIIVTISLTATEFLTYCWGRGLNILQKFALNAVFSVRCLNAVRPAHVVSEFLLPISGVDGGTRLPSHGAAQMVGEGRILSQL
jgi:hypothetical protein